MVANIVWRALGDCKSYLEPFYGSGAVLLARPDYRSGHHVETVCDMDAWLANVWRALQSDPDEVARWCDWPVNHADLNARRRRLLANEARLLENLSADETWYDARLAGYWVWAACCWIGSGLTRPGAIPLVSSAGVGVHALGQRPHVSDGGVDIHSLGIRAAEPEPTADVRAPYNPNIYAWFRRLSERLRYVRVICGDWTRVCGGNWQDNMPPVGIFFDPPYSVEDRAQDLYHVESPTVARDVARWALERGDRPSYRIVVAGYEDEHPSLDAAGWRQHRWSARGGYGRIARSGDDTRGLANRHRECLWFSPHCLDAGPKQLSLLEEV